MIKMNKDFLEEKDKEEPVVIGIWLKNF